MRHWSRALSVLAVTALLAVPAFGQNLLDNASFETPHTPDPGNGQIWIGDYATYSIPNAQGARVLFPGNPNHIDGEYGWESSKGGAGTINTATEQTVAVSNGSTVTLTGSAHAATQGASASASVTIKIWDGEVADNVEIDTITIDHTTAPNNGDWVDFSLSGAATSGKVTVQFTTTLTAALFQFAAVHLDNFNLTSDTTCTDQHSYSSFTNVGNQSSDTLVTITGPAGSFLDLVSGAKLIDTDNETVLEGTVQGTPTDTEIQFLFPTDGTAAGLYNLVTLQEDCNNVVNIDGFNLLNSNLLLNESFEVMEDSGNAQHWFGDYVTYSIPNSEGSRQHVPNPDHINGVRGMEFSLQNDSITFDTSQTVAVSNGDTVDFSGYIHAGPAPTLDATTVNEVTVTLWDGNVGDTAIASQIVNHTSVPTDGDWVLVQLSGAVNNTSQVTVQVEAELVSTGFDPGDGSKIAAVHYDQFQLFTSSACSPQHTVDQSGNPTPNTGVHNADTNGVSITGTNLDTITGVKLVWVDETNAPNPVADEAEDVLVGTNITTISANEITADFPTSAAQRIGTYNVLVEKESCPAQAIVDGFEIACGDPTAFTAIDPNFAPAGTTGSIELRISGTNLDQLSTTDGDISLRLGTNVVPGTNVTPDGSDLLVTFDFTSQPAGFYTLEGVRADTELCNPDPLGAAFELQIPCNNLLEGAANGSFDEFGPKGDDVDMPLGTEGWSVLSGTNDVNYNESIHNGGRVRATPTSVNYATTKTGGAASSEVYSDPVITLDAAGDVSLRGFIKGCSASEEPNRDYDHFARIYDGDATLGAPVLAEFRLPLENQCQPDAVWEFFTISGTTSQTTVTVTWGFAETNTGWAIPATHVDELQLCAGAACNQPRFDHDDDGDVDQADFAFQQSCITGTNNGVLAGCECANSDGDNDVDSTDMTNFEGCASGPGIPADETCDDTP